MKIQSIELCNFFQHRQFTATFTDATAIVGPNGSGKSNLLKAIKYSLTGNLSDTYKDAICRLCGPKDPVYVQSHWISKDEREITICRSIRPAEHWLEMVTRSGSGTREEQASRVNDLLLDLLGVGLQVADYLCFIEQDKLRRLILSGPSDRLKFFMDVMGISDLESFWQYLGQVRSEDLVLASYGQESNEAYQELLDRNSEEIAKVRLRLESLKPLDEDERRKISEKLQQMGRWKYCRQELEKIQRELDRLKADLLRQQTKAFSLDQKSKKRRGEIEKLQKQLDDGRERFNKYREALLRNSRREDLRRSMREVSHCMQQRPQAPSVARNAYTFTVVRLESQLEEVNRRIAELSSHKGKGRQICPMCGQKADLQHLLQKFRGEKQTLEQKLSKARQQDEALQRTWEEYDRQLQEFDRAVATYESLKVLLQQMGEDDEPVDRRWMTDYTKSEQRYQRLVSRDPYTAPLMEVKSQISYLKAEVENLKRQQSKLQQESESLEPFDEETYRRLESQLEDDSRIRGQVSDLESQLRALERQQKDLLQRKAQAEARIQKSQRVRHWVDCLDRWRAALHRGNLAQRLVSRFVEMLLKRTNSLLQFFENPFQVSLHNGTDFLVHMPDGTCEKMSRLSKGQGVMLAICLQLAAHELFDTSLEILALDEPTDGLDARNLGYLMEVIEEVAYRAKSFGRQLIIVTHHESLVTRMDNIIRLSGTGSRADAVVA